MTKHRLYKEDPKKIRDTLNQVCELATQVHQLEAQLIKALIEIDNKRYYVRYGFNSLRVFCVQGLKFSKTQGQRITTKVRQSLTPPDDSQLQDLKCFLDQTSNPTNQPKPAEPNLGYQGTNEQFDVNPLQNCGSGAQNLIQTVQKSHQSHI